VAPLVSVVLCAWNPREDRLREAVASALEQQDCEVELIVVDDGSQAPVADEDVVGVRESHKLALGPHEALVSGVVRDRVLAFGRNANREARPGCSLSLRKARSRTARRLSS
jgi:Glycosyl transferase family 2